MSEGQTDVVVVAYDDAQHREEVIVLWRDVFGYETAHNAPSLSIDNKLAMDDGLFFVAVDGRSVVGTAMAGYDGHRGWLYSVAVLPDVRAKGVGSALVRRAEAALARRGCVKINLQITGGNERVVPFYEALGFKVEARVSMGKVVGSDASTRLTS